MDNISPPSTKKEPIRIDAEPHSVSSEGGGRFWQPLQRYCRRHPFVGLFLVVIVSNGAGSIFNLAYNNELVANRIMDAEQKAVFSNQAVPIYNAVSWSVGLGLLALLVGPLIRCRKRMKSGEWLPFQLLEDAQHRLVNLPVYVIVINFLCWLPGGVFFPVWITAFAGTHQAGLMWFQFMVSFFVSALLTAVQTFFVLELYLMAFLYPDFFKDRRPAEMEGPFRFFSFRVRLLILWLAVTVMPLIAILVVAMNLATKFGDVILAVAVFLAVWLSGGLVFYWVGRDLWRWLQVQGDATKKIAEEKFNIYIDDKRPDEWGRLIDRFNDMAIALKKGREVHDTFGQFVGPEARDVIMERYPGLGGQTQEVTVLFADIRGFTRRTSGESPDEVFELLNRFITLAVRAMEDRGGWVNKFLGDGIMVLFGAPLPGTADDAVLSALDLSKYLEIFNEELAKQNQEPLVIGVGIHTGSAMVGCVGASMEISGGQKRVRRELTAIGETVNLCQRIEQLTKELGGPILISGQTKARLKRQFELDDFGPKILPGSTEETTIYRVKGASSVASE